MPCCRPQPTWTLTWRERNCACCRKVATKIAYKGFRTTAYYWICPDCDLPVVDRWALENE